MEKIVIFDDHPVIKLSIEVLVEQHFKKYQYVSVDSPESLLKFVVANQIVLLVFDINVPGVDTQYLLSNLMGLKPELKVLVFSSNSELLFAKRYIRLGAFGFLPKSADSNEIVNAFNTVINGKRYFSQNLMQMLSEQQIGNKPDNLFETLSEREFEVVRKLIDGASTNEICSVLGLKPSTIATHKLRIFDKLGVKNLVELYELYNIHNK